MASRDVTVLSVQEEPLKIVINKEVVTAVEWSGGQGSSGLPSYSGLGDVANLYTSRTN